jgi:hypothetical protein
MDRWAPGRETADALRRRETSDDGVGVGARVEAALWAAGAPG